MAKTHPAAALHLTKAQREAAFADLRCHNIDLAQPAAPIPLQHLQALPLQLRTRQVLPAYAQLLLRLRRRHRPPPLGSMRTPVKIVPAYQNLWKPPAHELWKLPAVS